MQKDSVEHNRQVLKAVVAVTMMAAATAAVVGSGPSLASAGPIPRSVAEPSSRSTSPLSPRLAALSQLTGRRGTNAARARSIGLPSSGAGSLLRRPDGRILVRLRLTDLSVATRSAIVAAGASFVADGHDNATATVAIATGRLADLASVTNLRWAQEELTPHVGRGVLANRSAARAGRAARTSRAAGPVTSASCPSGLVSEGDTQLKAAAARAASGVNGAGVKVGILSDSYNSLGGAAADVSAGELPGPANPCGHPTAVQDLVDHGGSDEGRAMAQIVHDLAPGATLAFRTAFNGEQDFANGIKALRDAGATVIVDDVSYFDEPMFQDGVIAAAIGNVKATGVTYFSSAANNNMEIGPKNVGSYEAPNYRPMACPAEVTANDEADCHDFNPAAGTSSSDLLTVGDQETVSASVGWNQPELGITTDLDAYLLDSSGAIVASSITANLDSQQASEFLDFTNTSGVTKSYRFVVARFSGTAVPRFKIVFDAPSYFNAVQWNTSSGGDIVGPTTFGHNAPLDGAAVAAVAYDDSTHVEDYSSRGPALYCWAPVSGTSAAPALSPCRSKPIDFAATDGGRNSFFGGIGAGGVNRFYGTSAAAPHAAAVAALLRQKDPCRTPAEILAALRASGRTVGTDGVDAAGSGLIDATTAITGLAACPPGAPAGLHVVSATRTSASIAWTAPPAGASPISSYRITLYAGQSSAVIQTIDTATPTPTSATVAALTAGTLYRFRVAARNGIGLGAQSAYSPHAAPPFASLAAFTTQQFQDFGGRQPTAAELSVWDAALANGSMTPVGQVSAAGGFASWGPKVDPITRLFYAFFQRHPDSGGLGYWSGRLRTGTPLTIVAASFAGSPEFQHTYGSLTNSQFVELVYHNVLGRGSDPGGRAYWNAQLDQHKQTRGDEMASFSESNEHKNRRAGEVNTVNFFFGMLRRVPTDAELATWTPLTTTSKSALITSLLGSAAYDTRV